MAAPRRVDRTAWADVLAEIKQQHHGTERYPRAEMERHTGIKARTLIRWENREVDVREESVRAVAEAYGINPLELLVRVGYYLSDEVTITPRADEPVDEIVALIMSSQVSHSRKRQMLEYLAKIRADNETATREAIERMIEVAGGGR